MKFGIKKGEELIPLLWKFSFGKNNKNIIAFL